MPSLSSVAVFALSTDLRSDANVVFAARTRRGETKGGGTTTSTARGGRRRRHGSRVQARKGLLAERFGEDETDNKVGEDDEDDDERECSCGSGETYEACCKRLHEGGIARDSSPESIVRARFTSYKENAPSFIVKSTHEESPDFAKRDAKDMAKAKAMARVAVLAVPAVLAVAVLARWAAVGGRRRGDIPRCACHVFWPKANTLPRSIRQF